MDQSSFSLLFFFYKSFLFGDEGIEKAVLYVNEIMTEMISISIVQLLISIYPIPELMVGGRKYLQRYSCYLRDETPGPHKGR